MKKLAKKKSIKRKNPDNIKIRSQFADYLNNTAKSILKYLDIHEDKGLRLKKEDYDDLAKVRGYLRSIGNKINSIDY